MKENFSIKTSTAIIIGVILVIILCLGLVFGIMGIKSMSASQGTPETQTQDVDREIDTDPEDSEYEDDTNKTYSNDSSDFISEDEAIRIALNHAGVTRENVRGLNARLTFDDGMRIFDVEFKKGSKEFYYEIIASTGEIHYHGTSDDW